MTTVAIISEYNPFHTGHKYQIDKIREEFGADTAVIAVMSGNYTQRADVAICDKLIRAECAVTGGVNLVLELPFPYSCSSAEIFASAAVSIVNSLGVVDYLSFGSESGNIEELSLCARIMSGKEYLDAFKRFGTDKSLGHAKRAELAYREVLGIDAEAIEFSPNNILAIEYLKAMNAIGSDIKPHTVKRIGAGYNDVSSDPSSRFPSAMAIRRSIADGKPLSSDDVPNEVLNIFSRAISEGELPCDTEKLSVAILSNLRLNSRSDVSDIYDAGGGLYKRLCNASFEANSLLSLLEAASTKKYTTARLKRAIWNIFFGVTSSDVRTSPAFTQVLAFDRVGMKLLKAMKKLSSIHVLTKPSDYSHFDEIATRQKRLSEKADSVFELTKPVPSSAKRALKLTPYIKE